jgi:cysteine desulfurase/selenocysteine lyase
MKEIYLDNAATTKTPEAVILAMDEYYRTYRANVHRGMYASAERATDAYELARADVAKFIGGAAKEVFFTKNATEGLNFLAHALTVDLRVGDEIVLSVMEHHANLVPWQMAARRHGLVLKFIPIAADYRLDLEAAKRLIGSQTRIVSVTQASNVLGTVNDIRTLANLAHAVQAVMVVDGAQSVPHLPVSVAELGCDFLAFSAHKMWGPTGIGAVWGRAEQLEKLEPWQFGGGMIVEATLEQAIWDEVPGRFEAGTPNISGAIGFGVAVRELAKHGMNKLLDEERSLTAYALAKLTTVEGLKIIGPATTVDRLGVISFTLAGMHPHDIVTLLDREQIAVRGGFHCAMPLLTSLGLPAVTRASFYVETTRADIDALVEGIEKVKKVFA